MADDAGPLPYILTELAEVAGVARAVAFAREHGGKRVSVPSRRRLSDQHPLVLALGRAGAERLSEMFGGSTVDVPMGPAGTLAEARRRMARALAGGATIDQAAGAGGLHRRTAQRMRRHLKDTGQGSLFGGGDGEDGAS